MTIIFDGKEFAKKKEQDLRPKIQDLRKKGIAPKLVSILVGDDPGSKLYTSLKKKAAERVGCEMEVREFSSSVSVNQLIRLIGELNKDKSVHGIMIQLPLPKAIFNGSASPSTTSSGPSGSPSRAKSRDFQFSIFNSIDPKKDVDGLRENSFFVPATVRAVISIIDNAKLQIQNVRLKEVAVVGSTGMIGKPLVEELKRLGYEVIGCDIETKGLKSKTQKADLLISTTGVPNLIQGDMIKEGAVVIDVGSPKGDVDFEEVSKKASFITPVPGGVGPVTISCLLENLVEAAKIYQD